MVDAAQRAKGSPSGSLRSACAPSGPLCTKAGKLTEIAIEETGQSS